MATIVFLTLVCSSAAFQIGHLGVDSPVLEPPPQTDAPVMPATNQLCDYGKPVCEKEHTIRDWSCPEGEKRIIRAFWGREPGDDQTCVEKIKSKYLRNLDCPGDDEKAAAAVTEWCNEHIEKNGACIIKASPSNLKVDGNEYDPCPGTAKYLRVCSICEAEGLAVTLTYNFGHRGKIGLSDERYSMLVSDLKNQYSSNFAKDLMGSKVTSVRLWISDGILYINVTVVLLPGGDLFEDYDVASQLDYSINITGVPIRPVKLFSSVDYGKATWRTHYNSPTDQDDVFLPLEDHLHVHYKHPPVIASTHTHNQQCDYGVPVCETKYKTINWSCPEDEKLIVRAFWGREPGDYHTCLDKRKSVFLGNLDCPGDEEKAAAAVTEWCNKHVKQNGECKIKASPSELKVDGKKYDPCPGTAKYLRVCSYCKAEGLAVTMASPVEIHGPRVDGYNENDERNTNMLGLNISQLIDRAAARDAASGVTFPSLLQFLAGNKEVEKVEDERLCSLDNRLCKNGGKCSNASGKPACICKAQFRGKFCEITVRKLH